MKSKLFDMVKAVAWALKGLVYNEVLHSFKPKMNGGIIAFGKKACEKCGVVGKTALFVSTTDPNLYLGICTKCKHHAIKPVAPTNPVDAATQGMVQAARDLKCQGHKADGTRCNYLAKDNGYCGVHAGQFQTSAGI